MLPLPPLTSLVVHPFSSLRNNSGIGALCDRIPYSRNLVTTAIRKRTGTGSQVLRSVSLSWSTVTGLRVSLFNSGFSVTIVPCDFALLHFAELYSLSEFLY
jgi:hypothetical protein